MAENVEVTVTHLGPRCSACGEPLGTTPEILNHRHRECEGPPWVTTAWDQDG